MTSALSGIDADADAVEEALFKLAAALREGNTHVQAVEHTESASVPDTATERIEVEYTLSDEFDGVEPISYPRAEDGGDE
jgi:hypothetical protein